MTEETPSAAENRDDSEVVALLKQIEEARAVQGQANTDHARIWKKLKEQGLTNTAMMWTLKLRSLTDNQRSAILEDFHYLLHLHPDWSGTLPLFNTRSGETKSWGGGEPTGPVPDEEQYDEDEVPPNEMNENTARIMGMQAAGRSDPREGCPWHPYDNELHGSPGHQAAWATAWFEGYDQFMAKYNEDQDQQAADEEAVPEDTVETAYADGKAAFLADAAETDNPFGARSKLGKAWKQGFSSERAA